MKLASRSCCVSTLVVSLFLGDTFVVMAQPLGGADQSAASADAGLIFRVGSQGESEPVTVGTTEQSGSRALQPDRRVTVELPQTTAPQQPGKATLVGSWRVQLPDGGIIWATEDPALGPAQLSVSSLGLVAFDAGRITRPVRFAAFSNYSAFMDSARIDVYRATDIDLVAPLASVPLQPGALMEANWDGVLPEDVHLRPGDELIYVMRVRNADGAQDETFPSRLQLAHPDEVDQARSMFRNDQFRASDVTLTDQQMEDRSLIESVFGADGLRQQNIPIQGSRVRLQGRDLPRTAALRINGQSHPVDLDGKMAAEYLVPIGEHRFDIDIESPDQPAYRKSLLVDVTGRYLFMVGLADLSLSTNKVSGSVEPLAADDRFDDDFLAEGRLAFYLRGKIKGKYLITAHTDTTERELDQLFSGYFNADPRDVFRRLDPDRYYPVYGDDSTTYRDVDTQGKLYVRMDWDRSQLLFGNFSTGITGTEYGQYSRALYGAAANLRARQTTLWGDPVGELRAFGSQAQTAAGHSEFLGTGGSLYYLKHTDLLPGSERIVLEVRDGTTGRVESRVDLLRGADYEIDELQGRVVLTRPLAQVARENMTTLTRDAPLDGYQQILLADYEFVPMGLDIKDTTAGVRAKQWFGNHLALGGVYIDENRAGEDYNLAGVDVTLQAGRGTFIKAEQHRSESTSLPVFYSDNGGLSFQQINGTALNRSGSASAVEARINYRELGWTSRDWSNAAWWREVEGGFSVARFDRDQPIEEYGAELQGQLGDRADVYGRYSRAERGLEALVQEQLTMKWLLSDATTLEGEFRHVTEERIGADGSGSLGGVRITQRLGSAWDIYGGGQKVIERSGTYTDNDALTAGARYRFGTLSNVSADYTTSDRGDALQFGGEYQIRPEQSLYANYVHSTDRTAHDPLFSRTPDSGFTFGQRYRLSRRINTFNESQYLKSPQGSGLSHTFGLDFYPGDNWNLGVTGMTGELERTTAAGVVEQVDRNAFSLSGGRTTNRVQWRSKVEYREDSGAEQREQWVTTNNLSYRINESLRLAARFNFADTEDRLVAEGGARFVEGNVGFALRPWNTTRWALFGKYTYLYDVSALEQIGATVAMYDQRSQILSLEGIYTPDRNWEFAGKVMRREGSVRFGRLEGQWADSAATFIAGQMRYGLRENWNALAEYRVLAVDDGGARHGALVGIDRDVGQNLRLGVGYNFTRFSDDLTDFDYDQRGFFVNIVGRY